MAYHTETRTFIIEVEVTATATVETGGGYSDEPRWTSVDRVLIDRIFADGVEVASLARMEDIMLNAAKEEFSE